MRRNPEEHRVSEAKVVSEKTYSSNNADLFGLESGMLSLSTWIIVPNGRLRVY
jgi:hypothetical protein